MKCRCCGKRLTVKSLNTHATSRITGRQIVGSHVCQNCGAISGSVYLGEFHEIVDNRWYKGEDPPQDRWVYYDLERLGSAGIDHVHGWIERDSRKILQTG